MFARRGVRRDDEFSMVRCRFVLANPTYTIEYLSYRKLFEYLVDISMPLELGLMEISVTSK